MREGWSVADCSALDLEISFMPEERETAELAVES